MLQELMVHDFAIIEDLDLSFENGMTALTGETGAGKSIIIDAVSLLAGARGSSEFIRTGAKKATLQGMFYAADNVHTQQALEAVGLRLDGGQVLLERDLYASGRNVCRINGQLVNTSTLRRVGETLVDIHGQNEHQELTKPESHIHLLDQFAGSELLGALTEYHQVYAEYQKRSAALRKKQQNEQEWAQRLDMLTFQVDEINAANLAPGQEEALTSERDRLANYQRVQDALGTAYSELSGDEFNPLDVIDNVMQTMQGIADLDPAYKEISESVASAYYTLQDAQSELSRQIDGLEWDENRLDEVEESLNQITSLKRKYGDTVEAVITYGQKAQKELKEMQSSEEDASGLEENVARLDQKLHTVAAKLTKLRHAAALKLEKAVHEQLRALYMAKTVFSVHFSHEQDAVCGPDGADTLEFYIQPNPGERAQPLAKTASGGELSRMMLALKTIFAESDGVTSIIFDEVDTGVSGRVAQAIANKIVLIAQHSQVLCITHLPQVAAMSDYEYKIEKTVTAGRTQTSVTPLRPEQRVDELARMLAGTEITDLTRQHASELLQLADKTRAALKDDE
ncbi:DNA repair protein RecN [Lacticaseibacillus songhuajiangensis]|jgi:DNA repair protein RecN (Recombination protein N)|uniref:DNA repair protein RecN n=1 Tax=Lacticaseibacillus songhuajiangensis TaxID=1296539 RepID=UPI000F7B1419|nr:DNA repair protein RecN [Lacticaseibacillus songhuajiangensis]